MTKVHSLYAKASFVALIAALVLFIFRIADMSISEYSFYDRHPVLQTISSSMDVALMVLALISVLAGLVSLYQHETQKTLSTISLSVISVCIYFVSLMSVQEATYVYRVDEAVVTNYGIFEIPTKKIDSTRITHLYEQRLLKINTDQIPCSKGITFGFNYVISGEPETRSIRIMKVIKYPAPGLQRKKIIIFSDTSYFKVPLNKLRYTGFTLEHDYELIPGNWEFEISYNGSKLLSKIFNVVRRD